MWNPVDITDSVLLERWVAVMQPMNKDYKRMCVSTVVALMAQTIGESWLFQKEHFDIALRFHFVPKRRRYQLANVGFCGITTPAEVLELVVDKGYEFMVRHRINSLFAIRPKNMIHEGIETMHQLVPLHPKLRVVVEHDAPSSFMWRIEHRELTTDQQGDSFVGLPRLQRSRRFRQFGDVVSQKA